VHGVAQFQTFGHLMKSLAEKDVLEIVKIALPTWDKSEGWSYNMFHGSPYLRLGEDVSIECLLSQTFTALNHFIRPEQKLLLYHDGMAGWRSTQKKTKGFYLEDLDEINAIIPSNIHFRDPDGFSDNYNFIDETGDWMITFCHENDWFAFHRSKAMIDKLQIAIQAEPGAAANASRR